MEPVGEIRRGFVGGYGWFDCEVWVAEYRGGGGTRGVRGVGGVAAVSCDDCVGVMGVGSVGGDGLQ